MWRKISCLHYTERCNREEFFSDLIYGFQSEKLRTTGMTHLRPIFHNARNIVCAEELLPFFSCNLVFCQFIFRQRSMYVPTPLMVNESNCFNSEKHRTCPYNRATITVQRSRCPACNANQAISEIGFFLFFFFFSIFIRSSLPLSFQSSRLSALSPRNRILMNYSAVQSRRFPGTPRMKDNSWGKRYGASKLFFNTSLLAVPSFSATSRPLLVSSLL